MGHLGKLWFLCIGGQIVLMETFVLLKKIDSYYDTCKLNQPVNAHRCTLSFMNSVGSDMHVSCMVYICCLIKTELTEAFSRLV